MILDNGRLRRVVFISHFVTIPEIADRRIFFDRLQSRLAEAGYFVVHHNAFKSYEYIQSLLSLSDLTLAIVDKWFASSTWKLVEIQESGKPRQHALDPAGNPGPRVTPLILVHLDESLSHWSDLANSAQIDNLRTMDLNVILDAILSLIGEAYPVSY
jgi:hypothetical protein